MRYTILIVVVFFSTACSVNHKVITDGPTEFERTLAKTINDVRDYSKQYADVKISSSKNLNNFQTVIDYKQLPDELNKRYDIVFYGDANRFLIALSERAGFEFKVRGDKGSVPHDIHLNETSKRLIDILDIVGSQLSNSLNLHISVNRETNKYSVVLEFKGQ
ncbi:MAG: DotD/TraH family lipoprotein [Pseudomonadota bacterium]